MQANNQQSEQQVPPEVFHALQGVQHSFNKSLQDMISCALSEQYSCSPAKASYFPARWNLAYGYFEPKIKSMFQWLFTSHEDTNFTYEVTDLNLAYCASALEIISGVSQTKIEAYFQELLTDQEIQDHVRNLLRANPSIQNADERSTFGRRVVWYALARILRPRTIVETGVDKGIGSLVLCAALRRNAAEGAPGKYFGTDINPQAGYLLCGKYADVGQILYGDSLASLRNFQGSIDLFINDSDHSADYETQEYEVIREKMSPQGIVLGDNAHCNTRLLEFSRKNGRKFLFVNEVPKDHWYPGGGIGISYPG
jgi:predicted O-methyltransferase YrrM